MTTYADRIRPTDYQIKTYLENLKGKKYQVPTFQREVVWEPDAVKKLWDSIFRFYPIGSILIWRTPLELQNHRAVGGHIIRDDKIVDDFQYILDGQQRTTFLLTALYGGRIAGRDEFDPTLYYDLTVEDDEDTDEESYRHRFLFWSEIDDRGGEIRRNIPRKKKYDHHLIVKLHDVLHSFGDVERPLVEGEFSNYDHPVRHRLRSVREVLDNYRLSFIELKGIEVAEVCQIFERINQEGKPLDIFDIVVAKTFRRETESQPGFYLRELVEDFRKNVDGNFGNIDDLTILQAIATILYNTKPDAGIYNITPINLNKIKTEQIMEIWADTKLAMLKIFDFFDNHLHLKGPRLIPYRYFYFSLASYFYQNPNPDYKFLQKYFWYYSFHNEDLLANTTDLKEQIKLLDLAKQPEGVELGRFLIDKERLRGVSYSQRGRLSSAILSLYANQEPRDWANPDRLVLMDVYYVLTDKPNLHHVFPMGYIDKHPGSNKLDANSLMNIAYLTQITNLEISDKNPIEYLQSYDTNRFTDVLDSHLIPLDLLEWSRGDELPEDALDRFIEFRIDNIINVLRNKLSGVTFDVIDTKESA